jgi:hypothetical protein
MSGTGKSYQIMRYLDSAHRQGVEIDVFDVHEEMHEVPGAVACKFSESTRLGFNPLVPSLDPHSGGIRRQIEAVVDIINRTSRKLGPRQESALKHLLSEVYLLRGMYPDNPASWDRRIITEKGERGDRHTFRTYTHRHNLWTVEKFKTMWGKDNEWFLPQLCFDHHNLVAEYHPKADRGEIADISNTKQNKGIMNVEHVVWAVVFELFLESIKKDRTSWEECSDEEKESTWTEKTSPDFEWVYRVKHWSPRHT